MQPTAARSGRSSIIYPITPLSSACIQQQQPQRILYAPVTIQANDRSLQTNYIYSRSQKSVRQITSMQTEGKINAWPMKSRVLKSQQYCQHQFVHPSNPVVVYKQPVNNFYPSQNPTNASFLLASSNFSLNPYTAEHYNQPNVAMLPQSYYKSPDVQHANPMYANQTQPQPINSYLMAATNASNMHPLSLNPTYDQALQQYKTVTTFSNSSQIPVVQNLSAYPNVRMGLVINESSNGKIDVTTVNCSANKSLNKVVRATSSSDDNCFSHPIKFLRNDVYNVAASEKSQQIDPQKVKDAEVNEERLSEASSTSFDFTIEAEKMVSALCDVKSPNDLSKDDQAEKENIDEEEESWFLDVESSEVTNDVTANKSVTTQTRELSNDEKLSEVMRKTALWGCTEAEMLLKSSRYCQDSKYTWLTNLSSATKTAITKSTSSLPVFGGDRILIHDLINALLRISNGWLALDNYLNKQYSPSLHDKYDGELDKCFQNWESNTHDLLKSIVQTFQKIEKSSSSSDPDQKQETVNLSFPGDVSMYTCCDLFDPFATHSANQHQSITAIEFSPIAQSTYSSGYFSQNPNFQYLNSQHNIKESKLRTKWTITESSSTTGNSSKAESNRKYRSKSNYPNASFQQSLNAEFSHLKNAVMESPNFANAKANEFGNPNVELLTTLANKNPFTFSKEESVRSKPDSNLQNQSSIADPIYYHNSVLIDSVNASSIKCNLPANILGSDEKLQYVNNNGNTSAVYMGKSESNDFKLVPKTKMTLLSQIEPNANKSANNQQEMTEHLSAWFASMRNVPNESKKFPRATSHRQVDIAKNALDLTRQLKMDTNRQLLTLKNMQSIQSAPWRAFSLLNENKAKAQKGQEECESSEDLRVYMKPGSYNVPKKRHQKKSKNYQVSSKNNSRQNKNQTFDNKQMYNVSPSLPTLSSISGSPNNSNNQSLSSNNSSNTSLKKDESVQESETVATSPVKFKESTWKAACASAEILLEALNVNKHTEDNSKSKDNKNENVEEVNLQKSEENDKNKSVSDTSSSETTDDDANFKQDSTANIDSSRNKQGKCNVKTDSWLMETLKIKSMNKNESLTDGEFVDTSVKSSQKECTASKDSDKEQSQANCLESRPLTYSDMTRKEFNKMSKALPKSNSDIFLSPRLINSKINDQNRKSILKKNFKNYQVMKNEETLNKWSFRADADEEKVSQVDSFQLKKRKKVKIRDGLVPLNSKKKPSLSTMTFTKLETIHKTIYQMEESFVLKCPSSAKLESSTPVIMMNEYQKIIKCPIFLETIGYKLRNRAYNKVENVLDDFRKIVQNSRLYHKSNKSFMTKIEKISQKLEELFEEHFNDSVTIFVN